MNKFTNAKRYTKSVVKNIPNDKPAVYRIQNNSGKELYIGIAKRGRVQDRLIEHLEIKKEKIDGAAKIRIAQVENLEKAKKFEKALIKKLDPVFNEVHKE